MTVPTPPFASLWVSPFRPFCVLGVAYGLVLMAAWVAANAGLVPGGGGMLAGQAWHGHEMLFGFAAARKAALAGMKNILAALKKRDPERAARVMREHLQVARHHLRVVLDDIARESTDEPGAPAGARQRQALR